MFKQGKHLQREVHKHKFINPLNFFMFKSNYGQDRDMSIIHFYFGFCYGKKNVLQNHASASNLQRHAIHLSLLNHVSAENIMHSLKYIHIVSTFKEKAHVRSVINRYQTPPPWMLHNSTSFLYSHIFYIP